MLMLGEQLAPDFDVTVVAPEPEHGTGLLSKAAVRGMRVKTLDIRRIDEFRTWLSGFGAALLHVHAGIGWEGHGLARAGNAARLPVVRTEHLPYLLTSVVQQAEYRAMLLAVDRRIAVSQAVAQSYADRGRGRIHVVANGISPRPAQRTRAVEMMGPVTSRMARR